jgi:glycosyltransferase involved in cell wall biosynthesis
MPLVFMADGLLDRIGGRELPGRCRTTEEAREKVNRILDGDPQLIHDIRKTQVQLLDSMRSEHCEPFWRAGLELILRKHAEARRTSAGRSRKRIALVLPVEYRGGTLRGAKVLAQAIATGSRQLGCPAEVVLAHLDDPVCYPDELFHDLSKEIERRSYRWKSLSRSEATRACVYAGIEGSLDSPTYIVPDDGMNQFLDCDLWIVISDRLSHPLLPVRPYLIMLYDYVQRYLAMPDEASNQGFIARAHAAEAVLVTTEFTASDARQYAGVPASKVKKVPLLIPDFVTDRTWPETSATSSRYFLWTTNLAPHKNHETALKALRLYYEKYDGALACRVTGVDTKGMFKAELPHLTSLQEIRRASKSIRNRLIIEGELADWAYRKILQQATFLWHPARIDNGTFSVVEAACLGIPSLSSDYPAMREIDLQFNLNLTWSDPNDAEEMARRLKDMETGHERARSALPPHDTFADQSVERLAASYWKVIREFL